MSHQIRKTQLTTTNDLGEIEIIKSEYVSVAFWPDGKYMRWSAILKWCVGGNKFECVHGTEQSAATPISWSEQQQEDFYTEFVESFCADMCKWLDAI